MELSNCRFELIKWFCIVVPIPFPLSWIFFVLLGIKIIYYHVSAWIGCTFQCPDFWFLSLFSRKLAYLSLCCHSLILITLYVTYLTCFHLMLGSFSIPIHAKRTPIISLWIPSGPCGNTFILSEHLLACRQCRADTIYCLVCLTASLSIPLNNCIKQSLIKRPVSVVGISVCQNRLQIWRRT